ncbi:phage tail spike protein [Oceanobacillus sp. CFH 90083]|uniref:phage tail spike protein n=1 Tax=Oceanobacillus sp. CFH 90083 TaxID=2592336 RepID=UPI00128B8FB5|nr:phage tail spike protein [Oceanobacillus sp. CFH 90083]
MELFILSQDEQPLTVISENTGLVETHYRIEVNSVPTEPFSFAVEADQEVAEHIKEENKVVFKDHEGDWRLMTIKEVDDSNDINGPITIANCFPTFLNELNDHIIVERRFIDQTADVALTAAVQGTRWESSVEVELGRATTNFYYLSAVEAISETINTWGGEFKDIVELDEETNELKGFYVKLIQRLGTEQGQRFEIDQNTTEIGRTVLSYPKTALYGRGSSLEVEDEDGEHSGGYTRYIDFGDVEWRTSRGDPVNKPLGQKWVGDPEALAAYGYEDGDKHRFGIFSNQDYEEPSDLLYATWEALQKAKKPEVNYRLSVELFDEKVSLGDTCQAIDRKFARPIEIQARVIALEYDLMDIEGTMVVEMGQFLDLGDSRLDDLEREVEGIKNRPPKQIIDEGSYPDRKPSTPVNLEAYGGIEVIQLYWDYADELFIKHYEVYGSRTEDFVPDTQHLLWRGDVSAFSHTVGTDEVWYYRVRAVNYHGRPSDWSVQVRAATHRVLTEDIMWGPELAERMRELHRISDIIGENGVNFDQISQEAKDLINQQARIYTDEEINATRDDLLRDISEISDDLQYIDGQLVDKVNVGDVYTIADIDGMFENTVSITRYETDMNGVVQNLEHQESLIQQNEREILNRVTETVFNNETGYLRESLADVVIQADRIEQTVSNIQIGGRNLIVNSKGDTLTAWFPWGSNLADITDFLGHQWIWVRRTSANNQVGIRTPTFDMKADKTYICSFIIRSRSNSGYDLNYLYLQQSDGSLTTVKRLPDVSMRTDSGFEGSIEGDGLRVWFTFSHNEDVANARLLLAINGRPDGAGFVLREVMISEGNMLMDWSPAPEEMDSRMTIAESNITQLADDISLKVNVDEIVSEINLNREGIRLSGALIHLNGLSLIDEAIIQNAHIADGTIERGKLVRAIIGTAQIDDLAVTSAKIASVNADKINAASLSAISSNIGIATTGILRSSNNNIEFNLNTGTFDVYSSASIRFHGTGGGMKRIQGGRQAFVSYAISSGHSSPMVSIGAVSGSGTVNVNDTSFRGIRLHADNVSHTNDLINDTWTFSRRIDQSMGSIVVDLSAGTKGIVPQYTSNHNYNLGSPSNGFNYLYLRDRLVVDRNLTIQNNYDSLQGWRLETVYTDGNTRMRLVGLNAGSYWANPRYYDLGGANSPFSYGFINQLRGNFIGSSSNPFSGVYTGFVVEGSDISIKENIKGNTLGLNFIKDIRTVDFKMIGNDIYKVGVIAQELLQTLNNHGVTVNEQSIVDVGDVLGVSYTQLIAPTIKAVQELDWKLEEEINWQRIEYQILKNKVTKLEAEVQELKEMVA